MNDKNLIQAARALLDEQMRASLTNPMLALDEMAQAGTDIEVSARLLRDLFAALATAPSPAQAEPVTDAEPSAREQKLAERVSWTTKQWYVHVGACENENDQIVFGTVMALRAMMLQFQDVTLYAAGKRAARLSDCAAPVESKPFMHAIMEPSGAAYLDEFCVATNAEDLHSTLNGLNDSPDAGYKIVPLYIATQPAPALAGAIPAQTGMWGEALSAAVGKFIKAKGRFHTEQHYKALVAAYDAHLAGRNQQKGGA